MRTAFRNFDISASGKRRINPISSIIMEIEWLSQIKSGNGFCFPQ
jgi:hypothetical protein